MAIFSAIGGFIASALLAVGVPGTILGISTASLIGGALAIGASVALSALTRPKLSPGPTPQAQAVINQSAGARIRGYGRAKLGGTRAFWDSRNGILYQAVMFHSGEVDAIEEWYAGDLKLTLNSSGSTTNPPVAGYIDTEYFLGRPNQGASSLLRAGFPSIWTAAHQLKGIAYVVVTFDSPEAEKYQEVFPEGYNTPIRVVARLSKVYDPRTGATAWSDNAALCILDYLTHPDGYRRSIADIDVDSFAAFANVCDQSVPLKAGGSERRYRLWGIYSLTEDPQDVLQRMCATCDAELYQTASGKIAIRGGVWTAPTVTIEDRDILGHQLEQGNNKFAAFNELKILYTSPKHDYQAMEAPPWVDTAAQAEQGPLPSDLSLDLVPSASQARRLAKIHRAKSNPRWRGTITTNLTGLNALGERIIRVVLPELGINDTFLVTSFSISPDLTGCEIGVLSLDASAYAWTTAEEADEAPVPQNTRPDLTIAAPANLTLRVVNRQVSAGTVGAAIRATVSAPSRPGLSLEAEYRPVGGQWEAMSVASGVLEAYSDVVNDGQTYEVRARWRTAQNTAGAWSPIKSIPVVADAAAPSAPTGFTATKSGADVSLAWTNPPTAGFYFTEVFRGTTATFDASSEIVEIYAAPGSSSTYTDTAPGAGTFYYWVRARNVAGMASDPVGPVSVTF